MTFAGEMAIGIDDIADPLVVIHAVLFLELPLF